MKLEDFTRMETWSVEERKKIVDCIGGLSQREESFRTLQETGIGYLTNQLKPRLQEQIESSIGHSNVVFDITGDQYAGFNAGNDPCILTLLKAVDAELGIANQKLDFENGSKVTKKVAILVAEYVEQAIVRKRFTQFGALLLDRRIRDIRMFFSARLENVNEVFLRLQHIVALLNLDHVEDIHDVYLSKAPRRLTVNEAKLVLGLRLDFTADDIKRLKI